MTGDMLIRLVLAAEKPGVSEMKIGRLPAFSVFRFCHQAEVLFFQEFSDFGKGQGRPGGNPSILLVVKINAVFSNPEAPCGCTVLIESIIKTKITVKPR